MGWFGSWFGAAGGGTTTTVSAPSVPIVPFSGLVDYSRDYLTWDNPVKIGLTSTRLSGSQPLQIDVANRRSMKKGEKFPSGGTYVSKGIKWRVPAALLEVGFEPKPGDVITDLLQQDGNYTAIDVEGSKLDGSGRYQTWWYYTIDLLIEHDLQDVIDIERAAIGYDAGATKQKSWPSQGGGGSVIYPQLKARVQKLTDEMDEVMGIRGFKGNYAVIVEKQIPALIYEDRIRWIAGGVVKYLEIRGIHNPQRIDELPVIDAEFIP